MIETLIQKLNGLPPEFLWLAMLLLCYASVIGFYRFFGAVGLYVYISIGLIGANIQVLKIVQFGLFPDPIALGTIWFSSLYLAADILVEIKGAREARKAILTGFGAYAFFTLAMIVTAGFAPTSPAPGEVEWPHKSHGYIVGLFAIQPGIFAAGVAAYLVSMLVDIFVFEKVKASTNGDYLWLRNNVSTMVAALVDSCVFSFLAWIVFAPEPLPLKTVIVTYIGGSLLIRFTVAFLDTPFIYLAKKLSK